MSAVARKRAAKPPSNEEYADDTLDFELPPLPPVVRSRRRFKKVGTPNPTGETVIVSASVYAENLADIDFVMQFGPYASFAEATRILFHEEANRLRRERRARGLRDPGQRRS